MASAHHPAQAPRYSLPPLPTAGSDFRLPSLKDLNFQYRPPGQGQEGPPLSTPGGSPQAEHVGSSQSQGRHDPTAWGRPSPTTPVSASMPPQLTHQTHQHPQQHQHHPPPHPPQHQHQHSPQLSAGHQQPPSRPVDYGIPRHDNGGYLTPGLPLSAQVTPLPGSVTIGPGSRGDDSHPSKRSRTNSNMSIPRDNRSHAPYPISQSPQYSPQQQAAFHPVQSGPGPPPHEQVHQQTGPGAYPPYGYPPQYMPPRAQNVHPLQPHHPQQPQGNPYLPPQQDSWDHQQQPHPQAPQHHHQHPAPQQQQQQQQQQQLPPPQHQHYQPQQPQQMNFASARTTALVPQTVDSRVTTYQPNHVESDQKMSEIIKHCTVLYSFASRYAQLQASLPRVQPPPQELAEMNQRAAEVVRLLEEYRRLTHPESERRPTESIDASRAFEGNRPPKRPWEDIAQDDAAGNDSSYGEHPAAVSDKAQSTAEQDMEIIRTKRATSVAGGPAAGGQPKSKYRKRSRATPPGKCHSCNIRETPEWRRGPDGARTLCNACGLHYAKLMRKRDKQIAVEGQAPRIDMDTLRASARAADLDKLHARSQASSSQTPQVPPPGAPTPPVDPGNQSHHQGSFQVVNMGPGSSTGANAPTATTHAHQIVPPPNDTAVVPPPPPSWAGPRVQSFMRTSQPSDVSPR